MNIQRGKLYGGDVPESEGRSDMAGIGDISFEMGEGGLQNTFSYVARMFSLVDKLSISCELSGMFIF